MTPLESAPAVASTVQDGCELRRSSKVPIAGTLLANVGHVHSLFGPTMGLGSRPLGRARLTPGVMKPHLEHPPEAAFSARFLERIRKSFAHDLRTPLGVIANYAAVLETHQGPEAEEVRELAGCIRDNAQRIVAMLRCLVQAAELGSAPPCLTTTDVVALARSELTDAGGHGLVRLASATESPLAELDADALAYAWRAYFALVCQAPELPVVVEIQVLSEHDHALVELRCAIAPAADLPVAADEASVDLQTFLQRHSGPSHLERALGLMFAEDLLESRGAALWAWGSPAARSGLRIRFPSVV